MNNNNDLDATGANVPNPETPKQDEINSLNQTGNQEDTLESLQDAIIRNDTIPETNSDTPGSSGAFPVGAFDTSKDLGS